MSVCGPRPQSDVMPLRVGTRNGSVWFYRPINRFLAADLHAPAPNPTDLPNTECPTYAMDEARSSQVRTAPPGRMRCMAHPNDVSRGEPGIKSEVQFRLSSKVSRAKELPVVV